MGQTQVFYLFILFTGANESRSQIVTEIVKTQWRRRLADQAIKSKLGSRSRNGRDITVVAWLLATFLVPLNSN